MNNANAKPNDGGFAQPDEQLDPYRYFYGGKHGIQHRFAQQFRTAWALMKPQEQEWFQAEFSEFSDVIEGICTNRYRCVTGDFVQAVAALLAIKISDACGPFSDDFDEDARKTWEKEVEKDGFACTWGTTREPLALVEVFVMDYAIERL